MSVNEQFPIHNYRREQYLISTDPALLDIDVVFGYLAHESYWSTGITREHVERFMQHSLCLGVYDTSDDPPHQIGFARAITDFTTFAYMADVFILAPYRGLGLGKWLVACLLGYPALRDVRKWSLNTRDAHGLYAPFGFRPFAHPDEHLIWRPEGTTWARAAAE